MNIDESLISAIVADLKEIKSQLREANQEAIKQRALVENIQVTLLETIADIRALSRVVKDGNGRPSLMERAALMERSLEDQKLEIRSLTEEVNSRADRAEIKDIHDAVNARATEDIKGKWQLAAIIAAAIFAAISSIITVFTRGGAH